MSNTESTPAPCTETPSPGPAVEDVPIDYGIHAPYMQALHTVYDEDAAALRSCIDASPDILETVYLGWPLLLHIVLMDWREGLEVYKEKNGRFDVRSEDFVQRLGGSTIQMNFCHCGGQTLLHVVAMNRPSSLAAMCSQFPHANVADYNQRLPEFYVEHRDVPRDDKALVIARFAQQSLISLEGQAQEYSVSFDQGQLTEGVRCFELPESASASLLSEIAGLEQVIPNSMHRYGKILLPQMQRSIHGLVACLLPAEDVTRVNHIHAFYIQYSDAVGQKSLDSHIDDSHWTINLCLSVSPDLRGSELVFDPQNVTYRHTQAGRGIIHRGSLRHHVEPLVCGQRDNVIVWVSLAPRQRSD